MAGVPRRGGVLALIPPGAGSLSCWRLSSGSPDPAALPGHPRGAASALRHAGMPRGGDPRSGLSRGGRVRWGFIVWVGPIGKVCSHPPGAGGAREADPGGLLAGRSRPESDCREGVSPSAWSGERTRGRKALHRGCRGRGRAMDTLRPFSGGRALHEPSAKRPYRALPGHAAPADPGAPTDSSFPTFGSVELIVGPSAIPLPCRSAAPYAPGEEGRDAKPG